MHTRISHTYTELLTTSRPCHVSVKKHRHSMIDYASKYKPFFNVFPPCPLAATDLHESDTQEISIPFTLGTTAGLTTPGLALGVGQRVNVKEETSSLSLFFDLTNDQYINLSEVRVDSACFLCSLHHRARSSELTGEMRRRNPSISYL